MYELLHIVYQIIVLENTHQNWFPTTLLFRIKANGEKRF